MEKDSPSMNNVFVGFCGGLGMMQRKMMEFLTERRIGILYWMVTV